MSRNDSRGGEAMMTRMWLLIGAVVSLAAAPPLVAQEKLPVVRDCNPETVAMLPATVTQSDMRPNLRQRFELRECPEGNIQVWAFTTNATTPSLVFDTLDTWFREMIHVGNVLVLVCCSVDADDIYVFRFHRGKPELFATSRTRDSITTWTAKGGEELVIRVPLSSQVPDKKGIHRSEGERVIRVPIEWTP
jgi:hypothetical protein